MQENVARVEVSVHDAQLVHLFNSRQELCDQRFCFLFLKASFLCFGELTLQTSNGRRPNRLAATPLKIIFALQKIHFSLRVQEFQTRINLFASFLKSGPCLPQLLTSFAAATRQ